MSSITGMISFPRPYQKEGAPSCGIYLTTPQPLQLRLFVEQLRHAFTALNESPYQRNMHALELNFPAEIYEKEREEATALVELCKRNGIVPIVNNDLGLAVECNAEGIIVSSPAAVAEARKVLSEAAIIGVDCANSKELAEEALAQNVDFVKFGHFLEQNDALPNADLSLLMWWSTRTHLPAVATGSMSDTQPTKMVQAGAGFIAAGDWVWEHEQGPKQAIFWLQSCIEAGLTKPTLQ